jgi:hypothetical protein
MRTYLNALGFDIWKLIIIGYTAPKTPPTHMIEKNANENNAK